MIKRAFCSFFLAIKCEIMYNIFGDVMLNFFSCPIYRIFGVPCAACGITRAYRLFFTGHFKEAFLMHPLFLLPLIFLFRKFRRKWIVFSVMGIFLAVYIIRFLLLFPDVPPFTYNSDCLIGGIK